MTQIHWINPVTANFNTAADWSGGVVPGSSDDAILDAPGTAAYTVTISTDVTVASLQTAATAAFSITASAVIAPMGTGAGVNAGSILVQNGANLLVGGMFDNTGSISVNGGATFTSLEFEDGQTTLTGGGVVTLSDSSHNFVLGGQSSILTNVDNTIKGAGTLGDAQLTLVNQAKGVIDATGKTALILNPSGALTNAGLIETTGAGGMRITNTTIANTGTAEAAGSGLLVIQNATIANGAAGKVVVFAGSHASLETGVVSGGTVTVNKGGLLTADGGINALNLFLLDNEGTIIVSPTAVLGLGGMVTNPGLISLQGSGGSTATINLLNNVTLSGGGTMLFHDSPDNFISGVSKTTLDNVDNLVVGACTISVKLINEAAGDIAADDSNPLIIDAPMINHGLLEAYSGGDLIIRRRLRSDGTVSANGGNVTVIGAVTGSGAALVNGATLNFASTFNQSVTFTGTTGILELAQSQGFTATVTGFSTSGGTSFDLGDIGFVSSAEATYAGSKKRGVLTVTDGTHTAQIHLIGDYRGSTFIANPDGNGGVIIDDPTKSAAASPVGAAPAHRFIATMAALGGAAGSAAHASHAWQDHQPMLLKPRASIA